MQRKETTPQSTSLTAPLAQGSRITHKPGRGRRLDDPPHPCAIYICLPPAKGGVMRSMTEGLFLQETTPQSPVGDSSPCTGEPKNILSRTAPEGEIPESNGGRPMVAPTERRELCTHRRALSVSRRPVREQTKPSPVGEGGPRQRWMRCHAPRLCSPHSVTILTKKRPKHF